MNSWSGALFWPSPMTSTTARRHVSPLPLRVDQEQLFKEEEDFAVVEEGKWSYPLHVLFFVLYNCITVKFTFMMILH
jgi:hypothetical protein